MLYRPIFGIVVVLVFSAYFIPQKIRYFNSQTISLPPDKTQAYIVDFKDSIGIDTLFQVKSKEGYPISYYRNIKTSVCFDNKCRLLDIVLYWNITGRYLGFELPEKEFLSKTEHEPFVPDEYKRLNEILADSMSALRTLSYNALVPRYNAKTAHADGITSPSAPDVLEYIVKGAAYTTYIMWHFVYGTTQNEVENRTGKELSAPLLLKILESPNLTDKIWALNHSRNYLNQSPELQIKLFEVVDNKDYNLAERAINSVNLKETASDNLQILLVGKFAKGNYALKKLILSKLKEAPQLHNQTKEDLAHQLKSLNGELLGNVLDIFKKHDVNDAETCRMVAELLENDNSFISQKAYAFLKNIKIQDEVIENKLVKYKSGRDLNRN
ncbi:hypothetical protein [Runella sp.]|uniref:hypothetical protein n=1 Tax=Runella sp. TaxID=1960881 RepID=UPI00260C2714|nr:hypothetical protein [Runella sp.]